jgi:16S rRNA (cytosine967-C5)-methyltransferase
MTPAARVQAAVEILDRVIVSARDNGPAADTIIADWFRTRRFAGSKDRRAIRDHVYVAIRAFGEPPESGRSAMIGLLGRDDASFDGSPYGPAAVGDEENGATRSNLPLWLGDLVPGSEHGALLERAPLDLRVNPLKGDRDSVMAQFEGAEPIADLPDAIRLTDNLAIEHHPAWREGLIEVQDAGSQWIAEMCTARSGMTVVDLCAGAGGKTLALAAAMGGQGRLIASDTNRNRLSRLIPRAQRAGAAFVETRLLNPNREMEALADLEAQADVVLVDAPCSGSGTWRRNPEARWRLTRARLDQVVNLQAHVLHLGAALVKPGGALVYAVCSLIDCEGADQVSAFLAENPDWQADLRDARVGRPLGAGLLLTPSRDGTDGFFIARLAKRC